MVRSFQPPSGDRTPSGTTLRPRRTAFVGALLVLAAAVAFRLGLLQAPGEFDEFYHLLAARGWVETGSPRILDGEYWRGTLFTRLVAALFGITGSQDLPVARLVAIAAGSLMPVVLFLWIYRVVGLGTAVLAAAFAVLWPQGILESQLARFYTIQALTFFSGAVAFYMFLVGPAGTRILYGLVAVLFWCLAVHFQVSSVIGIAAALLGGLVVIAVRRKFSLRGWIFLGSAMVSLSLIAVVALSTTGVLERAWAFYRWTPLHAAETRDYYGFYFNQLETSYGVLWLASVVLVPLGLRVNAGLTVYCGTIFTACFLVHSFGGMKSLRYLSYATPCLFVLWALGLRSGVALVTRHLDPKLRVGVALVAGAAVVATTQFVPRSLQLAGGEGLPPRGDWSAGRAVVGDWSSVPFVATTRELQQIAYIGPYDVLFSQSRVTELRPPTDFGIDPRTGRPVVGTGENIAGVLYCVPDGILVTSPDWWYAGGWEDGLEPVLTARDAIVNKREADEIVVIRWQHKRPVPDICATLFQELPAAARASAKAS